MPVAVRPVAQPSCRWPCRWQIYAMLLFVFNAYLIPEIMPQDNRYCNGIYCPVGAFHPPVWKARGLPGAFAKLISSISHCYHNAATPPTIKSKTIPFLSPMGNSSCARFQLLLFLTRKLSRYLEEATGLSDRNTGRCVSLGPDRGRV